MTPLEFNPTPYVHYVKLKEDRLAIGLYFKNGIIKYPSLNLSMTFFNEQTDESSVLKGKFFPFSSSFNLVNIENRSIKGKAEFQGNKAKREIAIPSFFLPPFTKVFLTLRSPLGFFHETSWAFKENISHFLEKKMNTVAIIPCYNVVKFCEKVIRETAEYADFVIAVDDGSTDGTSEILQNLASGNKHIYTIGWKDNRGKGFALLEGFTYALKNCDFNALITLDGDAQHTPSDIPKLVDLIKHGADLGIGVRITKLMPLKNRFANESISLLLRCLYPNAPLDTQSGLRAFNKNLVKEIASQNLGGRYEMEFKCLLLALNKHRKIQIYAIHTVYIEKNRSSHYLLFKDSFRILRVFFKHTLQILFSKNISYF